MWVFNTQSSYSCSIMTKGHILCTSFCFHRPSSITTAFTHLHSLFKQGTRHLCVSADRSSLQHGTGDRELQHQRVPTTWGGQVFWSYSDSRWCKQLFILFWLWVEQELLILSQWDQLWTSEWNNRDILIASTKYVCWVAWKLCPLANSFHTFLSLPLNWWLDAWQLVSLILIKTGGGRGVY